MTGFTSELALSRWTALRSWMLGAQAAERPISSRIAAKLSRSRRGNRRARPCGRRVIHTSCRHSRTAASGAATRTLLLPPRDGDVIGEFVRHFLLFPASGAVVWWF